MQASDTRLPTQGENDALQGTSGTPSDVNRFVTSIDGRVPTLQENDALQGAPTSISGVPDNSNRYVLDDDSRLTTIGFTPFSQHPHTGYLGSGSFSGGYGAVSNPHTNLTWGGAAVPISPVSVGSVTSDGVITLVRPPNGSGLKYYYEIYWSMVVGAFWAASTELHQKDHPTVLAGTGANEGGDDFVTCSQRWIVDVDEAALATRPNEFEIWSVGVLGGTVTDPNRMKLMVKRIGVA